MVFSSVVFLCIFFPIVFLLHTILPNTRLRNCLLVVASLLFYAYGEPVYILLLLLSVAMNYVLGLWIAHGSAKAGCILAVILNLLALVVFKYAGFLAESCNLLLPRAFELPVPKLSLPIGISFYTFQALSYVIDVYRKEVAVQKSYFRLLLYVSFFPQLIAGPIVKYHDIEKEITNRVVTLEGVRLGLIRFSCGLGKKVLLANCMAYVADAMFALPNTSVGILSSWMGALAYVMQIYFDFSGYSDMAIGLGKMFGFHFLENFNYPYISGSIKEFWRRWHISLSTWFRDYLYIPLGGNRKGKTRTFVNKYLVFLATGIWHGANGTFLLWGLYHGTLQMLEGYHWIPTHKKWKGLEHVYCMLAVTLGFVLFRADNVTQAAYQMKAMFGFGARGGIGYVEAMRLLNPYYITVFLLCVLGCTPLLHKVSDRLLVGKKSTTVWELSRMFGCLGILMLALMALAANSYNPFIYFRF